MTTTTTVEPAETTTPGRDKHTTAPPSATGRRISIVGGGHRFWSGITKYTATIADMLAEHGETIHLVMWRDLCPKWAYPGRKRIGKATLDDLALHGDIHVDDTLDWWWGPHIVKTLSQIAKSDILLLQYWTGTSLHTYLLLARWAKRHGTRVIIEFHETLDTSEANIPGVKPYVRTLMRQLTKTADAGIVHSTGDRRRVKTELPLGNLPITVIEHVPYHAGTTTDQELEAKREPAQLPANNGTPAVNEQPYQLNGDTGDAITPADKPGETPTNVCHFGVLRAYKGIDELADAWTQLTGDGTSGNSNPVGSSGTGQRWHLTIAGETWQDTGNTLEQLARRHDVTWHAGYQDETTLARIVDNADIIVLPYRRSRGSGPLAVAIAHGKTVVASDLPALRQAAGDYPGVIWTEPNNPHRLAATIRKAQQLEADRKRTGTRWQATYDRQDATARYQLLFDTLDTAPPGRQP